jgi:hypothetical protein
MANIQNAIRVGVYSKLIPSESNTFKTAIQIALTSSVYGHKLFFHIASQIVMGSEITTGTLSSGHKYLVTLGTITETSGAKTLGQVFTSDGTGIASSTNRVRPQAETILPYVVYDLLPINAERDSVNKFYEFIMQFVVSSSAISECETISGYLTDLLEDSESTLSFTGYSTIRIEREPQVSLGQIDNVWNIAVPYRIQLQKN